MIELLRCGIIGQTKTPSIMTGLSVSLAESIRFELMHPNYWMTD